MKTLQLSYIAALKAAGYKEVPSKSSKFRKMVKEDYVLCLWLGKKGAVRIGKTISDSTPAPDFFVRELKKISQDLKGE